MTPIYIEHHDDYDSFYQKAVAINVWLKENVGREKYDWLTEVILTPQHTTAFRVTIWNEKSEILFRLKWT